VEGFIAPIPFLNNKNPAIAGGILFFLQQKTAFALLNK